MVRAPRELIEDACQTAWATLLRAEPNRDTVFAWLRVVAIHEAYRLSAIDRRDARLERLGRDDGGWHEVIADPRSLDERSRPSRRSARSRPCRSASAIDLALKVAGCSYEEIRAQSRGRTCTNVNKSLVKARAHIRRARPRHR